MKKRTKKTFERLSRAHPADVRQGIKVFWFFFSKKNMLASLNEGNVIGVNMNKSLPLSVRLQPELNDKLAAIASALDRPKSWVIEQAIADYVAVQSWHLAAIDEGIKAADEGRVVAHEDVAAWVQSWDSPDELPMPACG